ncbi:MAG: 2-isopropylmalate synthase [Spirochaetales bacterium]|nr:2-isopropylmalate synthase [Spirochaetales bacterium]
MPKYQPFPKIDLENRMWPDAAITKAPIWCSVDLRDGNQALATPMNIEEKLRMFQLLVDVGFKEIEVGFPSASQIDFDFLRRLIDGHLIPDDVWIQVLTQSREHLIRRTIEGLQGAGKVIVHLYNSTSPLQRKVTFNKTKEEIKEIAATGTKLVKSLVPELKGAEVRFEYSPESFSDTETDYALEVCEAVMDVWEPTEKNRIILNLPDTVQWTTPNIHADQVEWFIRNMKHREKAIISLHTHNDRGTGVAATELALLAGAERVEGTLFGNGERTGNLDIIVVALNMFANGVDPGLDFGNIPAIRKVYEECTKMTVHERHPYSGDLVFTAFSGSHQDAIKKGMDMRAGNKDKDSKWEVPYLPIDPQDIGRTYQAIIRINSQSGKGGVAYIMSRDFGIELPKAMHPEIGAAVNRLADESGRELSPQEIYGVFKKEYLMREKPLRLVTLHTIENGAAEHGVSCHAEVEYNGEVCEIKGRGNGPIDAFVHAMQQLGIEKFSLTDFHEHAISRGSEAEAVAFVQIERPKGSAFWGAGVDTNISYAGLKALLSAYNRSVAEG